MKRLNYSSKKEEELNKDINNINKEIYDLENKISVNKTNNNDNVSIGTYFANNLNEVLNSNYD